MSSERKNWDYSSNKKDRERMEGGLCGGGSSTHTHLPCHQRPTASIGWAGWTCHFGQTDNFDPSTPATTTKAGRAGSGAGTGDRGTGDRGTGEGGEGGRRDLFALLFQKACLLLSISPPSTTTLPFPPHMACKHIIGRWWDQIQTTPVCLIPPLLFFSSLLSHLLPSLPLILLYIGRQ